MIAALKAGVRRAHPLRNEVARHTQAFVREVAVNGEAGLLPKHTHHIIFAEVKGATVCSHFNDSGFWLVRSLIGLDEKTTLKTWTIMETLVGGTGFIVALIISFFV